MSLGYYDLGATTVLALLCLLLAFRAPGDDRMGNRRNLLILLLGLLVLAGRLWLAPQPIAHVHYLAWPLTIVALVGLFASGAGIGGGVVKLLIAVLPWVSYEHWLILLTLSMLTHALLSPRARVRNDGDDVPFLPALFVAAVLLAVWQATGLSRVA